MCCKKGWNVLLTLMLEGRLFAIGNRVGSAGYEAKSVH